MESSDDKASASGTLGSEVVGFGLLVVAANLFPLNWMFFALEWRGRDQQPSVDLLFFPSPPITGGIPAGVVLLFMLQVVGSTYLAVATVRRVRLRANVKTHAALIAMSTSILVFGASADLLVASWALSSVSTGAEWWSAASLEVGAALLLVAVLDASVAWWRRLRDLTAPAGDR